jgi:GTP-binding protein
MRPTVALVGRPNVGKSTLFNRLVLERRAIVENRPGVTRDRLYGQVQWLGRSFSLIDTGGLVMTPGELEASPKELSVLMRQQAEVAIEEADLVLFILDGKVGPTAEDKEIALLLRRAGKKVLAVVNKLEADPNHGAFSFWELSLGEPLAISAEHGMGIGELLETVFEHLPEGNETEEKDLIRVALLGRPNVGKSSLVNTLVGSPRCIVSDIPGTTRDSLDTDFAYRGQHFLLIDTAGLRRRSRRADAIEFYSSLRTERAIDRCDVAVILLDPQEGITEQDERIVGLAHEAGRGVILAFNKWDLACDPALEMHLESSVAQRLSFVSYAPALFISAKTGLNLEQFMEEIIEVAAMHRLRVKTSKLNEVISDAVMVTEPPSRGGRRLKIFYASQVGISPPQFVLFVNQPELMHFSYLRYLENRLREAFSFEGTPIKLFVKGRKEKE